MIIDKNIPIYQIVISGNEISEYYSEKSVYSFNQLGYNNIERVEATTPDSMPDFLSFTKYRWYNPRSRRHWLVEEKAIWYSHYACWEKVKEPSIIIEHDCILYREIPDHLLKRSLWSFGMTEDRKNLAALGYLIKPSASKKLMSIKSITGPVDGWIHPNEPWYEKNELSKEYVDKNICAKHYINKDVGTTKPTLGLRK